MFKQHFSQQQGSPQKKVARFQSKIKNDQNSVNSKGFSFK